MDQIIKWFYFHAAALSIFFCSCGSAADVPSSIRGGGLFGSRVRYYGRVQKDISSDPGPLRLSDAVIQRTPLYRSLNKNKTRSLPHSPSHHSGYGSLPRSNQSAPPNDGMQFDGPIGSSASLPLSTLSSPYCPEQTLPILETLTEDSPRVEEKGKGTKLVRNESVRSTTSVMSSMTIDEPDLTFMQNRILSNESEVLICDSSEGLMSITEEQENEQQGLQKIEFENNNSNACNGHAHQNGKVNALDKGNEPLEFVPNAADVNEEKISRDSKTNITNTSLSSEKSHKNGFAVIWKIFLVCFFCVMVSALLFTIIVIEVDSDTCKKIRHSIPDIEYFQQELYEPFKGYMKAKLHGIEHFH